MVVVGKIKLKEKWKNFDYLKEIDLVKGGKRSYWKKKSWMVLSLSLNKELTKNLKIYILF